MAIVIEDNVPLPPPPKGKNAEVYEAAKQMKVGQSIVIPKQKNGFTSNLAKSTGFRFRQQYLENETMRIWRIE